MSDESPSFWTRVARTLRIKSRPDEVSDDLPKVGNDGLLAEPVEQVVEEEVEEAAEKAPGPLARWSKRDQTIARLQEGYEQVTGLIEETQKHLVLQGERSERICTSLEQLAESMSDLPAFTNRQAETLDTIAAQMEVANTRTQQMTESLSDLPKIARTQSDTLSGMNRQLQMAGEQSVVTSQTLDKLGSAIQMVGQANRSQTSTLKQMDVKTSQQNELLASLIARQSKRFTMLFVVTLLLAAAAVAVGTLAITLGNK